MRSNFEAILATATEQESIGNLHRAAEIREQALLLLVSGRVTHESAYTTFIADTLRAQRAGADLALLTRTINALRPVATPFHAWFGEFQLCDALVHLGSRSWNEASLFTTTPGGNLSIALKASQITAYIGHVANFVYAEWLTVAGGVSEAALGLASQAHDYVAAHAPTRNALNSGVLDLLREILTWHNRLPSSDTPRPVEPVLDECIALLGEHFGPLHFAKRLRACVLADYRAEGTSSRHTLTLYRDCVHSILGEKHYGNETKRSLALSFHCDMLWLSQYGPASKLPRAFLKSSVVARHVPTGEREAMLEATSSLLLPQAVLNKVPTQSSRDWSVCSVQLLARVSHSSLSLVGADDVLRDLAALRSHLALCGINHPVHAALAFFEACAETVKSRGREHSSRLIARAMSPSAPSGLRTDLESAQTWLEDFANARSYQDPVEVLGAWPLFALKAMGLSASPEALMPNGSVDARAEAADLPLAVQRIAWLDAANTRAQVALGSNNVFAIQLNLLLLEARCLNPDSVTKALADDILNVCNDLMKASHLYLPQATRLREMQINVLEQLGDYSWAARICNYVRSLKGHSTGAYVAEARAALVEREIENLNRAGDHAAVLKCWDDFGALVPDNGARRETRLYIAHAANHEGRATVALEQLHRLSDDLTNPTDVVDVQLRIASTHEGFGDFASAEGTYGSILKLMHEYPSVFDSHHCGEIRRLLQRCAALRADDAA
ncbi:hypothetical protein JT358_09455 [Micrococcales bacterium 31B]|nr:hypothetical protein [Micrococcales bacterium 31B]